MGELGTMVRGQLTGQAAADPAETFLDGYLGHPEVGQVAVADRGDVPGTRAAANGPGHKLGQRKLDLVERQAHGSAGAVGTCHAERETTP